MISAPPIMFFALLTVLAIFLNGFGRRTLVVVNQIALDVGVALFCISFKLWRPICLGTLVAHCSDSFLTIKLITSALLKDTDRGDSSQRTKPIWIRAGAVGFFQLGC